MDKLKLLNIWCKFINRLRDTSKCICFTAHTNKYIFSDPSSLWPEIKTLGQGIKLFFFSIAQHFYGKIFILQVIPVKIIPLKSIDSLQRNLMLKQSKNVAV